MLEINFKKIKTMWEIIDEIGTIHSGSQEEMETAFHLMTNDKKTFIGDYAGSITNSEYRGLKLIYKCQWKGDLKLIEIHNVYR